MFQWNQLESKTNTLVHVSHSSFEQKKSIKQFPLGLWYYFRHYRPQLIFCPQSTRSRWRCNSLKQMFKKELQMKIGHHFQAKKTSATPKFCKQNFSRMHHIGDMNFLSLIAPMFDVQKNWFRNFVRKNFYLGGISMGS